MTCANCKHNWKEKDICLMWGTPPDNHGIFNTAERCGYYEPQEQQETQNQPKTGGVTHE